MRLIAALSLAIGLSLPANAQVPGSSARAFLDDVRAEIGADASLPRCEGRFEQMCSIDLGRSFVLTTQATTAGELISVKLIHGEIEGDPPERAAAFVDALSDVHAGENSGVVTALLSEAITSDTPVEKVIDGVLYRADATSEVFLEVRPASR